MATIKDVAKLAGVSPSAVSKYFISPDHMREKTKERIAAAVESLNYHPNQLARSLRSGCSGVVAITVPDARNPQFGRYIHLMQGICFNYGLVPLFIQVRTQHDVGNAIQLLRSGLPDGVICSDDGWLVNQLLASGLQIPLVQISPNPHTKVKTVIFMELKPGIQLLCQHLEEQGIHRFSYIGSEGDFSSEEKLRGIQEYCCCHTAKLDDTAIFEGSRGLYSAYESGYQQCKLLLQKMDPLPEVIICASDDTALGVLKCLTHNGLRVPEDILLAGYDDTESAFMSNPSITSVHIPLEPICNAAVEDLNKLLNGQETSSTSFPTSLSIRTSTLASRNDPRIKQQCTVHDPV